MPLDPYQVLQADHAHGLSADLQDLRAGQQILVGAYWLQVGEKVKLILGVDLEGEVRPERQRSGVDAELQVGRRSTQGELQRSQGSRQTLEVLRRATVAQVDVVRHARAAHQRLRLPADHHELDAGIGQQRAEALKRTDVG